jgi:anti-sigma regulatory factor (Ser/Thr protein kinase)
MPTDLQPQLDLGDHVVQLYGHDGDLIMSVARYLGEGLRIGHAGLVIATRDHCDGFAHALAAAGIDVSRARATGTLVEVDAADTVACLMVDGSPDAARFDTVVAGLVRDTAATGRPVRAYGEMVGLLWEAGAVAACIELEELWNGLTARLPVSLLCAYPVHSTVDEAATDALIEVCHLHAAVIGESENQAAARFDRSMRSPRAARHFVGDVLERWGRAECIDDAMLVVTELATNAVRYAASSFTVLLSRGDGTVRVAVRDDSRTAPHERQVGATATSGRGLTIVDGVSRRWGHELLEDGKLVWAELAGGDPP